MVVNTRRNQLPVFDRTRPTSFPLGAKIGAGWAPTIQADRITQLSGSGTYTLTFALPAGSLILDLGVQAEVLWNAGTSASLIAGDGVDPDGFIAATNLNGTDLLVGEQISLNHPQDKAGAFIATPQRKLYQATARNVIFVVTQVGTGAAGRTFCFVEYVLPYLGNGATKV